MPMSSCDYAKNVVLFQLHSLSYRDKKKTVHRIHNLNDSSAAIPSAPPFAVAKEIGVCSCALRRIRRQNPVYMALSLMPFLTLVHGLTSEKGPPDAHSLKPRGRYRLHRSLSACTAATLATEVYSGRRPIHIPKLIPTIATRALPQGGKKAKRGARKENR